MAAVGAEQPFKPDAANDWIWRVAEITASGHTAVATNGCFPLRNAARPNGQRLR